MRPKRKLRSKFVHRPRLVLRSKERPKDSLFEVEIRACPARDIPHAMLYGYFHISAKERETYSELTAFLQTIRTNISNRYKIIQNRKRGMITTRVLLERESDLYFLAVAHPTMICRAYKYR